VQLAAAVMLARALEARYGVAEERAEDAEVAAAEEAARRAALAAGAAGGERAGGDDARAEAADAPAEAEAKKEEEAAAEEAAEAEAEAAAAAAGRALLAPTAEALHSNPLTSVRLNRSPFYTPLAPSALFADAAAMRHSRRPSFSTAGIDTDTRSQRVSTASLARQTQRAAAAAAAADSDERGVDARSEDDDGAERLLSRRERVELRRVLRP
jgi:hypothetical protein